MQYLIPVEDFKTTSGHAHTYTGHYNVASFEEEWQASLGPEQTPPNEASHFAFIPVDFIEEGREAGSYPCEVPSWQDHTYAGVARNQEDGKSLASVQRVGTDASNRDYLEEVETEAEQLSYEWEQTKREGHRREHLQDVEHLKLKHVNLSSAAKNLESHLVFPRYMEEELLKQIDGDTRRLSPADAETSKEMPVPSSVCNELLAKDMKEWSMEWMRTGKDLDSVISVEAVELTA